MILSLITFGLYTGSGFTPPSGSPLTGSDFLYGFIILIIMFSSPFIYAYYRDKRAKEKRRRDKEIENRRSEH